MAKVTVGEYYYTQIFSHNVQFTTASAQAALSAVTFNASSIATAEAIVNSYVQTAPSAAQAATASQTEVNLVGISTGQDLTHTA
jgi:Rieske Fe-S protein